MCLFCGCAGAGGDKNAGGGTVSVKIDCSSILENMDKLKPEKKEFVPEDGILLDEETTFSKGDTAFDVLKRVCKEKKIQLASRYTPLYDSYYVEAINQLYEFDCGANSGWTYSVNGEFPNYGASEVEVKDGDSIEWRYTCDLGSDVGNDLKK